jgi:hypothetical protein
LRWTVNYKANPIAWSEQRPTPVDEVAETVVRKTPLREGLTAAYADFLASGVGEVGRG